MPERPLDPTRVSDQPALTTSRGRSWLILGGLLAGISVAVLIPMIGMPPIGVALTGVIVIPALYLGMVIVCVATPRGRLRLTLLAVDMLAIGFVALLAVLLVAERAAEAA